MTSRAYRAKTAGKFGNTYSNNAPSNGPMMQGPHAAEAMHEARMHTKNIHDPEVKRQREQAEKMKRYQQMKRDMLGR